MENPCRLVFFGDSVIRLCIPKIIDDFDDQYSEVSVEIIDECINEGTSNDAIDVIDKVAAYKADVVVVSFGIYDWRKGIDKNSYRKNIEAILVRLQSVGCRVIICSLYQTYDFGKKRINCQDDEYSDIIRGVARDKKVKIADINALWKREIKNAYKGLKNEVTPNEIGIEIMCKSLMWIIPRKNTTVLWQYNGREAKCNYNCPYCYYNSQHNQEDRFTGIIDEWHSRFLESFGSQHLVFYLAFGEPTIGKKFPEIINMISEEKNWELRITSNLSSNLKTLGESELAKSERVNINASFHPYYISKEEFLKKLLYLRNCGIEASIVYVAYPEYLSHLEEDILFFAKYNFVVHLRRFQGYYKNKLYPWSYSEQEMVDIAKYSDDGMIKYMLNQYHGDGILTYSGIHFFVVDNAGNVGYDSNCFEPYTYQRNVFGNIHTGNFRPNLLPSKYPAKYEGTVDGVANIVEANYKELEGNNVLSFSRQGGVYKDVDGKVIYKNVDKDFSDPIIRAEYNFEPRNLTELMCFMKSRDYKENMLCLTDSIYRKIKREKKKV